VTTLRARGMGHIVDFVPNHVGVMGADNEKWMDVLEHGQASRFADFFDIAWSPPNHALQGKLLVPVLGAAYGTVLESGDLRSPP
jgi:(1->4)-alpha-D-glucan 1-alpha-D-glucosylmutase